MTNAFLYKVPKFHLSIFIYVLLLLYNIRTDSISQRLFYLAGSTERHMNNKQHTSTAQVWYEPTIPVLKWLTTYNMPLTIRPPWPALQ